MSSGPSALDSDWGYLNSGYLPHSGYLPPLWSTGQPADQFSSSQLYPRYFIKLFVLLLLLYNMTGSVKLEPQIYCHFMHIRNEKTYSAEAKTRNKVAPRNNVERYE
jgi:hypothetical protein